MITVEYDSNNSGGHWWLKDEHWKALNDAGWFVDWGGTYFCHSKFSNFGQKKLDDVCASSDVCKGHRRFDSPKDMKEKDRFLGSLASHAHKDFPSIKDALAEFEKITKQDVSAVGCNCCGAPHSFSWEDEIGESKYASGEDLLQYMYPGRKIPSSIRECLED